MWGFCGSKATSIAPVFSSLIEDLVPRLAAIGGAENATFGVWTEGMTESGHKDDIGIVRIHDHLADRARILQADVLPGFTGVHRLPDAVTLRDVAANAGFAGSDINHVRVGDGDGDAADAGSAVVVKNRRPGVGAVG